MRRRRRGRMTTTTTTTTVLFITILLLLPTTPSSERRAAAVFDALLNWVLRPFQAMLSDPRLEGAKGEREGATSHTLIGSNPRQGRAGGREEGRRRGRRGMRTRTGIRG